MVVQSQIKEVLVVTGTDADEAERPLTPDDDQSVPEAAKLMRAIRVLIGKCLPDEKAGLQHLLTDLKVERPMAKTKLRGRRGGRRRVVEEIRGERGRWRGVCGYGSLAPYISGPRDVPRCGALSLLQKTPHYRGGSSRNRC
jgi:hypothetical protein